MSGNGVLRDRILEALRSGKLPSRSADRRWGGLGSGACCAVCGKCLNADELEFELEFATGDNGGGAAYHHVHLGCYTAWQSECRKLESSRDTVTATELSGAVGEPRFDADEREPPAEGGPA